MSQFEIESAARFINYLNIRMTDCAYTYDHMMDQQDKAQDHIRFMSSLELFEVLIRLTKRGVEMFHLYVYRAWAKSSINVWEVRKIDKTIKTLLQ